MELILQKISKQVFRIVNKHTRLEAIPIELPDGTRITHRELHVIEAIGKTQPCNVTDLSKEFGVSKSAASQIVTKLVKKKVIKKGFIPCNNKEYHLQLTEAGQHAFLLHEQLHKTHMLDVQSRIASFSESQLISVSTLFNIFEQVLDERLNQ